MDEKLNKVAEALQATINLHPKTIHMSEETAKYILDNLYMEVSPDKKLTALMGIPIIYTPMEFGEIAAS